ncbi:MAG: 5-(carboxyamino)imidazole ribonucleotide mutase [Sulfurisoma sp.]|nr:5-(carboxyamino)imidazole ribonucleotide mutase [Sulfurisoma sp.]
MSKPLVGIVMGSDSDWPVMKVCAEMLKQFGVAFDAKVLSAHRTPDAALDYASTAQSRGMKVLIGAAGGAAHLAGVLAAKTELPVLAVAMLALSDADLAQKLSDFRARQTEKVLAKTLPEV